MIKGTVRSREGRIRLAIRGARRKQLEVEAVIDTGFTGSLCLPPDLIASLGLRWKGFARGILADGREVMFDVYVAAVIWDRAERRVLVNEADADPLVGMTLLSGYELRMQVCSGGRITIKRLGRS